MRFLTFDRVRRMLADPDTGRLSPVMNWFAGSLAGVAASTFCVTPAERIKTALIDVGSSSKPEFNSTSQAIRVILQRNGISGLYSGYIGTTLKQTGTTSFRLGSYNTLKDLFRKYELPPGHLLDLVTGSSAGLITTLSTQPFDVVKTRCQSAQGTTTVAAVKDVFLEKGIRGFWAGTTLRLVRNIFSGAILFSVYESTARTLRRTIGQSSS